MSVQLQYSHFVHGSSILSVDNSANDSASNVDFIQSFSKLRDVSSFIVFTIFVSMVKYLCFF